MLTTEAKTNSNKIHKWSIHRFYLLFFLFFLCCIFYYLGEIIEFFKWSALRWQFFYGVHDIHRLVFVIPIMYAGYYFGTKPAVIILILTICAFLPRAMFISPYPDPLLRAVLFTVAAAAVGILYARECEHRKHLERLINKERREK